MTESDGAAYTPPAPKFVSGSLRRHILVMTGAGAFGLMAIFVGELANILFVSLLDDTVLVAAIGYASIVVFMMISVGIGLSIAATALVSPAIGAGQREKARRLTTNAIILSFVISACMALTLWILAPQLLKLLGAMARTHQVACEFARIVLPAMPALSVGMTCAAILRSEGDAKRAMYVTLTGAAVNVALDPILIFSLGLGIHGAAIASACARLVAMAIGLYGVVRVHNLAGPFDRKTLAPDSRALARVAIPAVATALATPFANGYVTASMAPFGDGAVAAWAIIGRVIPVAFGAIFALSASIGPIIGQNYGAAAYGRLREAYFEALKVTAAFTFAAWVLLATAAPLVVAAFRVEGVAAELIYFFCRWLSPLFVFLGALFVTNAVFNTLGRPHMSTLMNWSRATLGTVPFVTVGGMFAGAHGVLAGNLVGGIFFGVVAVWLCTRHIDRVSLTPR
ncbi:MAG: MATE family efflux transporter [Pseudomonadota bacterium]